MGCLSRPRGYDPFYDRATLLGVGQAHAVSSVDEGPDAPLGVMWVPDPEKRRGWREYYVYPSPKPGAERRPLGFRRP